MEAFKKHVSLTPILKNHMKKMSVSINMRTAHLNYTVYHHHTLFRMAIGKNSVNVSAEESVEKKGTLPH